MVIRGQSVFLFHFISFYFSLGHCIVPLDCVQQLILELAM